MTSDSSSNSEPAKDELFVSLLTSHHSRILGYIRTLLPQKQDAEDVFQKVSLTLWQKFDEFDRQSDFFPWAAKIAFYSVCNYRRKLYREKLVFSEELMEIMSQERTKHLEGQESRLEHLLACVEKLDRDDQSLLMQAYGDSFSIKELATETGKAVQTLYNRLAALRRGLVICVQKKTFAQRAST